MNGAESLVRTLVAGGVDVCFANPGTSEMHFVAALDRVEGMRCVLGLFEGVVTGAADGYFRMKGTPASTLLHLGPGLANGLANLHNAKKAHSGIVNIVGQHATYHIGLNAPLTSDIEGLARPMSAWVRTSPDAKVGRRRWRRRDCRRQERPAADRDADLARRYRLERSRRHRAGPAAQAARRAFPRTPSRRPRRCCMTGGTQNLLLITGSALTERGLALAQQIAGKTGCKVMGQTYHPRMARGRGRFSIDRIPYVIEQALPLLKDFKNIILVEANDPIAFFAYPNKPSHAQARRLRGSPHDRLGRKFGRGTGGVARCAPRQAAGRQAAESSPNSTSRPGRSPMLRSRRRSRCAIPENAIIVDESITTGRGFFPPTAAASPA